MRIEEKNEIEYHKGFEKDLNELKTTVLRGKEKEFRTHLNRVLSHIEYYSPQEIFNIDNHEKLKNVNPACFSLHLQGKGFNVRFLTCYVHERYLLLVAFNEIGGKSKNGYSKHINLMKKRLEEWEDVYNDCKR